jgi:F420H2 dehydrogenase subunit N
MNGILASIIILAVTFAAVILLDVFGARKHLKSAAVLGALLAFAALLLPSAAVSPLVHFDAFTIFFAIIGLAVTLLVIIASHEATAAYHGSLILSAIGMILAASANDLILLYISIELVTVPTYVLVAYHRTAKRMEAATKYFIVSIVASALLLLGLGMLASAGTTTISEMSFQATPYFLLGITAFIAGIGFKLGIFPFNFWIPDVYEGAPSAISGLLAGASKKAAYAAFLRVAVVIAALHNWSMIFAALAALSMTVPNIIALMQANARRMLAYSIMSHAGFLLLGIALATELGYAALLFHAFGHAFMVLGAFLVLGVFAAHNLETIDQLKGAGWRNPFLGFALTIFLLSLAGIPLLVGFASKFYLFYATIDAGYFWLAALAILNSVISLYYYFRIIRAMYAYPGGGQPFRMRPSMIAAIIICLVVIIAAGIYPAPFIRFAHAAVAALA